MYAIMELHFSFVFLTSLAVPASSQDNSMVSTHQLHTSNGTCWMTFAAVIDGHPCSAFVANSTFL